MNRKLLVNLLSVVTILFFCQAGFSQNILAKGNMERWTDTTHLADRIRMENITLESTIMYGEKNPAKRMEESKALSHTSIDTETSNNKLADSIRIYPNPGNGKLNIILNNTLKGKVTVRVMDITGRVVYKHVFTNVMNQMLPVNISNEPSNLYFISISNRYNMVVKKFMKR